MVVTPATKPQLKRGPRVGTQGLDGPKTRCAPRHPHLTTGDHLLEQGTRKGRRILRNGLFVPCKHLLNAFPSFEMVLAIPPGLSTATQIFERDKGYSSFAEADKLQEVLEASACHLRNQTNWLTTHGGVFGIQALGMFATFSLTNLVLLG